jgi:hypothetical protein
VKVLLLLLVLTPAAASAQTFSQRGFVEAAGVLFPQRAGNDPVRMLGELIAREEVFYKPAGWIQFAAGADLRAGSYGQVEDRWRVDYSDRSRRRPPLSIRRLSTTLTRGRFTLDAGKQFVRWGKTDIVTPTDSFAPRDFLNVVDSEFLAVTALRGVAEVGSHTVEVVWVPRFTPSRIPLLDQRWSTVPPGPAIVVVEDGGATIPSGAQTGIRWSHLGGIEYSLSYFDGFNSLPVIRSSVREFPPAVVVTRLYPRQRTYGAAVAAPGRWFTLKAEAAYVAASADADDPADDYVLYVVQLERQTGEWVLVVGYAGEAITRSRSAVAFAPDRGLSRTLVARAAYTVDSNRSLAVEGAVRQDGGGVYVKAEYSQLWRQRWRTTVAGVAIGGDAEDFLGQYRRNSHATITLRYSF